MQGRRAKRGFALGGVGPRKKREERATACVLCAVLVHCLLLPCRLCDIRVRLGGITRSEIPGEGGGRGGPTLTLPSGVRHELLGAQATGSVDATGGVANAPDTQPATAHPATTSSTSDMSKLAMDREAGPTASRRGRSPNKLLPAGDQPASFPKRPGSETASNVWLKRFLRASNSHLIKPEDSPDESLFPPPRQ